MSDALIIRSDGTIVTSKTNASDSPIGAVRAMRTTLRRMSNAKRDASINIEPDLTLSHCRQVIKIKLNI